MAIVCPSRVTNVQRGWWCGWGDIFCHKLWTESKRGTGFGLWPSPPSLWPAPTRLCPHLLGVDLVWWKWVVAALWWTDVLSPGESRVLGQERGGGLLWVEHLGGWGSVFKARCSLGQEIRRATSHRSAIDRTSLKQIEFDKIHQFLPSIWGKYTHKCTQNMEWIEKEASKCLKVKESWSEIRKSSVARCLRRPPSRTATRARLRNFVLDENLVQELLMIVEFGWCKIIQIKV